ncbi:hypothetical protein AVEN_153557-1 [Araneus ventricosus]|uniref:Uncharacterized protein n=1 Tax=Araneus ventricosus TaxID=182803 RepID=A0A4Y2G8F6_ARAVE|nr:hypothetical protein AVEN_153557-1 [Araneus ventricosus]
MHLESYNYVSLYTNWYKHTMLMYRILFELTKLPNSSKRPIDVGFRSHRQEYRMEPYQRLATLYEQTSRNDGSLLLLLTEQRLCVIERWNAMSAPELSTM